MTTNPALQNILTGILYTGKEERHRINQGVDTWKI